jgi:DNA-binding Lrp family transcriptional regulator
VLRQLCTEKVRLTEQYAGVEQKILRELDPMAIKILSAMWKYGPRNLLEISRRTGIPFTSVYHRVERIESKSGPIVYVVPKLSKIGMVRVLVLATVRLGCEDAVTRALTAPNLWSAIESCEGNFTCASTHSVPVSSLGSFTDYVSDLCQIGLVTDMKVIPLGDYVPNFPNFIYYDPSRQEWTFPWNIWLRKIFAAEPTETLCDPLSYSTDVDEKDLLIVRKLEANARKTYSELAPVLGISLYGVKYHFDKKLTPSGIVSDFQFNVVPYPKEVSALHEIMLDFDDSLSMNKFVSAIPDLFFVVGFAKVLGKNAILLRTYILESQLPRLFMFFSELAKANVLRSYSAIRKDIQSRRTQTISHELFDKEKGWMVDFDKLRRELATVGRTQSA